MNKIRIIRYQERYARNAVEMWRISKEHALGIGDEIHSFDEQLRFVSKDLVKTNDVFLAIEEGKDLVRGLIAFDSKWINQLYVHVDTQKLGIGSRLLALAVANRIGPIQLYTFEINLNAQQFYEKKGFKVIARGSSDNEENLPDILYQLDP